MKCAFCGEEKTLINAHIIPRPFHQEGNDEGDPYVITGPDSPLFPKRAHIGVYDQNILRAECDGFLGQFDKHAIENLLRGEARNFTAGTKLVGRTYPSLDRTLLLKFIVSMAWRACIANQEMFRSFTVGRYEALMLAALKDDDELSHFDAVVAEFDANGGGFLNPHHTRFGGVRFVLIYANRFAFYLKVDQRPMPETFRVFALTHRGPVRTVVRDYLASKEFGVVRMVMEQPKLDKMRSKWASRAKRKPR